MQYVYTGKDRICIAIAYSANNNVRLLAVLFCKYILHY